MYFAKCCNKKLNTDNLIYHMSCKLKLFEPLYAFGSHDSNSPLSHGGRIVPGDQKSFALPRQASQWKPWG